MAQFLIQNALLVFTCFRSGATQLLAQHVPSPPFDDSFDMSIILPQTDEIVVANPEEDEQSSQPFFSAGERGASPLLQGTLRAVPGNPIMWPRAISNYDVPPPTDFQWSQADDEDDDQYEYLKTTFMAAFAVACVTTGIGIMVWRWQRSNRADLSAGLLEKEQDIERELDEYGIASQSKKSAVQSAIIEDTAFESLD